jgi:hypothetical protein
MLVFLLATGLSIIGMIIAHSYVSVQKLKTNWAQYRCNPLYMPFAGAVKPEVSSEENFTYCSNAMAGHYFSFLTDGISQYSDVVADSLGNLAGPLSGFRDVITNLRGFMLKFASGTLSKATNSISVFVHYLLKIQDVLKRFVGEGYIGALMVNTMVDFIWSFVTLCISVIKTFVFSILIIAIFLSFSDPLLLVAMLVVAGLISSSGF